MLCACLCFERILQAIYGCCGGGKEFDVVIALECAKDHVVGWVQVFCTKWSMLCDMHGVGVDGGVRVWRCRQFVAALRSVFVTLIVVSPVMCEVSNVQERQ